MHYVYDSTAGWRIGSACGARSILAPAIPSAVKGFSRYHCFCCLYLSIPLIPLWYSVALVSSLVGLR